MSSDSTLKFVREEDFVEYFLFPQLLIQCEDNEKIKNDLENVLKQINNVTEAYTSQYIWHKDEFNLTIRTEQHQFLLEENNEREEILPPHLYGITHYGDNILDEWFIVYLLYEITKKIPGIIGRVIDSDGEFLLIEAANVLPKWANPDTCEQRVYIFDGHLQLVQNSPSNTSTILPITTAINKIWQNSTLYKVSKDIQSCIDERFKDFQGNMENLFHYQIVKVPLAIAAILKQKPSLIASACRAFCERDTIDMRAIRAMRYFPPENRIRIRIKFTRCLYAMLLHNNYVPDRRIGWNLPQSGTEEFKEDILGVKIACGFEILACQARQNDDIENDRSWKTYLNSLVKKGYFKDYLEGSKDYNRLLDEAKCFYKENRDRFRTSSIVGQEILKYLNELEINAEELRNDENNLLPSDSDDWLNISSDELDEMLTARYGINKLYSSNGNVNAAEFTRNIQEFLDKESGLEGVEVPSSSSLSRQRHKESINKNINKQKFTKSQNKSTDEINFDPDSFQTHVKNFLDFVIPEDDWESTSEMSDYEDDDDLEKNIEDMTNTKMTSIKTDLKLYMDQMDRELAKTNVGKTFQMDNDDDDVDIDDTEKIESIKTPTNNDDFDDIETFKPINIDVNTLKSMMHSYKAQIGGTGPATNLLGAMGIGIKKKNDETLNTKNTKKDNLEEDSEMKM